MTIINQKTGEVYEIDEPKKNDVVTQMFTDQVLEMYEQFEALKQAKEMFEWKVKKVCEENGIKSVDNEYWSVVFIPATVQRKVDVDALKEAGIYDEFAKESPVRAHVRVRIK